MPGPIFWPSRRPAAGGYMLVKNGMAFEFATAEEALDVARRLYPTTECTIHVPAVDPMNLAAYGPSRPHVDGKMAPPGQPWVGKSKGRKRR